MDGPSRSVNPGVFLFTSANGPLPPRHRLERTCLRPDGVVNFECVNPHHGRLVKQGRRPAEEMPKRPVAALRAAADIIEKLGPGAGPVECLAEVYRDKTNPVALRIQSASALLPYLFHRLESLAITGPEGAPLKPAFDVQILMGDSIARRAMEDLIIQAAQTAHRQRGTVIDVPLLKQIEINS